MKRGLILSFIVLISLLSFTSAYSYSAFGGWEAFDSSLIVYGGIFVLLFALINFLLGRTFFRENQATRAVISIVLAFLSTYGIATSNFSTNMGSVYLGSFDLGNFLPTILTILFIVGIIYFIVKWGFKYVLMILGGLLIIVSLTNIVYEKNIFLFLGIFLLIIGLILQFKKPKIGGIPWQRGGGRGAEDRERQKEISRRARNDKRIRKRKQREIRRNQRSNRITRRDRLLPPHR